MQVIRVRNVNHALPQGLALLAQSGIKEDSRNGPVLRAPEPVTTVYSRPLERVLFSKHRDANPFFHMFEGLWMLAGSNDISKLTPFVSRMAEFSDDGKTQWGAYGYRWRRFFGTDQLIEVVELLRASPNTRRAVLSMWAPMGDLVPLGAEGGPQSKDVPCNTHIYFGITNGALDMTVLCRSNDVVWGAYGANAAHFAFLLEFVAYAVGVPAGRMFQVSNNFHIYSERTDVVKLCTMPQGMLTDDRYPFGPKVEPLCGGVPWRQWLADVAMFVDTGGKVVPDKPGFLRDVAWPMCVAHTVYKEAGPEAAMDNLLGSSTTSIDWILAASEWLLRRAEKAK